MEWISVNDRMPDSIRCRIVVFSPKGLYEDDCGLPSFHVIYWYRSGFSEEKERHDEVMGKVTYWMRLPEVPKDG